jgi:hypothetical protein
MKKKIWKLFLILFISLSSAGIIFACGWGFDEDEMNYQFFDPSVSGADHHSPFFRSYHLLYGGNYPYDNTYSDFNEINIDEWYEYFKNGVKKEDLKALLYSYRNTEIDTLITFLKNKDLVINPSLRNNSLLSAPDKKKVKDFLNYLSFARSCEPWSKMEDYYYSWDEKPPGKDTSGLPLLISKGQKLFSRTKDAFIKQRCQFQLIRLEYFGGMYDKSIARYKKYAPLFTTESMKYRSMGYAAGAYYKKKQFSQANYLYSRIYEEYDMMQVTSHQSFHPVNDSDWINCLKLAKNDQEKIVLWHLLGSYEDELRGMQEIYSLNPKSEYLDLLLVRAVNIMEETVLPQRYDWEEDVNEYNLKVSGTYAELISFVQGAAKKGNTSKPYLWNLSAGYLSILAGKYDEVESYFTLAEKQAGESELVKNQIRSLRLIKWIEEMEKPDPEFQSGIIGEISWLKSAVSQNQRWENAFDWTLKRLAEKHFLNGDTIIAQLFDQNTFGSFYDHPGLVAQMKKFMVRQNLSEYESFALKEYPISYYDIIDFEATTLLYAHKLKAALAKFNEVKGTGFGELNGDPFIIHNQDCHDCDHAAPQKIKYTKKSFVERMIELESLAKKDPKNASNYYFLMANGFYNMTWYGNGRVIHYGPLTGSSYFGQYDFSTTVKEDVSFYDCSKAKEYYLKACYLSKDREFKAKCYFMSAKCALNSDIEDETITYSLLRDSFPDTKYYNEVIEECGYMRTFLGR